MSVSPIFDLVYSAVCFHFVLMGLLVVFIGFKK